MYANINISNTYINMQRNHDPNIQILTSTFSLENNKKIIEFIKNAVSKYTDFSDIVHNIYDECIDTFDGKWTISIGDINRINSHSNADSVLSATIGPYKIIITYCE